MSERTHAPSARRLKRYREQGVAPSAELALRVARLGVMGFWLFSAFDTLKAVAPAIWACAFSPALWAPTTCLADATGTILSDLGTLTILCVSLLVALSAVSRLAAPVPGRPISPLTGLAATGCACALAVAAGNASHATWLPTIGVAVAALAILDAAEDRYRVRRLARMTSQEVADEAREQMMSEFARRWVRKQTAIRSRTDSRRRHGR